MKEYILDTTSLDSIYSSLSKIMKSSESEIKKFFIENSDKFENFPYDAIDLDSFYNEFNISKDSLYFEYVTIHHVTARLIDKDYEKSFSLNNLKEVLLSNNSLTNFFYQNDIKFEMGDSLELYYKNRKIDRKETSNYRFYSWNDYCINGFLFSEEMPYHYRHLFFLPEIVTEISKIINKPDLKQQYIKNKSSFVVTIKVNINDFIFDDYSEICSEFDKTELILKYVINYLFFKTYHKKYCRYPFDNPIIRMPDNKNVSDKEILNVRKVLNCDNIFKK